MLDEIPTQSRYNTRLILLIIVSLLAAIVTGIWIQGRALLGLFGAVSIEKHDADFERLRDSILTIDVSEARIADKLANDPIFRRRVVSQLALDHKEDLRGEPGPPGKPSAVTQQMIEEIAALKSTVAQLKEIGVSAPVPASGFQTTTALSSVDISKECTYFITAKWLYAWVKPGEIFCTKDAKPVTRISAFEKRGEILLKFQTGKGIKTIISRSEPEVYAGLNGERFVIQISKSGLSMGKAQIRVHLQR